MKVCWFSCGISSFVACYLAKDIDKIIYTHVPDQHPDSLRFLHTYVWGYDVNEKHRADSIIKALSDYDHEFPLIEQGLTKSECHGIADKLGLKRPLMYDLGYPNNNCIGCVKGGMGYWNKIRIDFPKVFERRAKLEREIGHSCINGVYLDELEPDRGRMDMEVMEDCTIACQLLSRGIDWLNN